MADQVQVVGPYALGLAVGIQLSQRSQRTVEHHGNAGMGIQPLLFRGGQGHAVASQQRTAAAAPAVQNVVAMLQGDGGQGLVQIGLQLRIVMPHQHAEAPAFYRGEALHAQAEQVVGLDQVVHRDRVADDAVDLAQAQRLQRAAGCFIGLQLAERIGGRHLGAQQLVGRHGQPRAPAPGVEGGVRERHQHGLAGQVGHAQGQVGAFGLQLGALAGQVDLAAPQRIEHGHARSIGLQAHRRGKQQAQMVGRDALEALAIDHFQGRMVGQGNPHGQRPARLQPLAVRWSEPGLCTGRDARGQHHVGAASQAGHEQGHAKRAAGQQP